MSDHEQSRATGSELDNAVGSDAIENEATENDQIVARHQKLQQLQQSGSDPYLNTFRPTHRAQQVVANFEEMEGEEVRIAGRLMLMRGQGKVSFADLRDESGRIQLFVRVNQLGEMHYEEFRRLDLGDIIGVTGTVMKTRAGEVSLEISEYKLLSKALRPLPDKWHGLKDVELRYRRRYLDLMTNPRSKEVFEARSKVIQSIRSFLVDRGYIEVETPILNPIAGGAAARPFKTHHNALDMDLYLRIAPELYLKRLLVGGFERVFEIGKTFRNEGISTRHNPEFTLLEAYEAYGDYISMMKLTEELYAYVAEQVTGSTIVRFQGRDLDFTPPWPRITMLDAIQQYAGVSLHQVGGDETARELARAAGFEIADDATYADVITYLLEEAVEPNLVQPTFVTQHPVEISPLAKRNPENPRFTDRFEPYANGWEIANGFTELNDPIDQRQRFEAQAAKRAEGDEEAHMMDDEFLLALEYGMPPAGGLGIGIDRMVMLLTDSVSIRDVLLFPHMRPI